MAPSHLPSFQILRRGALGSFGKNAFNGETSSDDPWSLVHDLPVRVLYAHAPVYISYATYSFEKGWVHRIALPCRTYPVTYQCRTDPDKSL